MSEYKFIKKKGHKSPVTALQLLNNGYLASSSSYIDGFGYVNGDSKIFLWNPYTGTSIGTLISHTSYATCLEQLENGFLVSGSRDATIKIWNTTNQSLEGTLVGHKSPVSNCQVLSNGNLASSAVNETSIFIWDMKTYKLLFSLSGHKSKIV